MQMLPLLFPICILKYFSIRVEASREDKPASGQLRGDAEEYSKHVCQKVSLTKVCFQLERSVAPRTIRDYSQ